MLIGEVDIAMRGDEDEAGVVPSDDSQGISTEEPFAKKCIVDEKAYSHSQMVSSDMRVPILWVGLSLRCDLAVSGVLGYGRARDGEAYVVWCAYITYWGMEWEFFLFFF